ncbi:FecR family protein [Elongatibacter sediminis]|uniref:FecR domain-containing protein n=1 Tax=Elongatibacter sediminis TaxID=3119006 RepID=A0AAW9R9R7_9GAMM
MENVTPFPNRDQAKEEAGLWLARLDRGELSASERDALREWLGKSRFHEEYLRKLVGNWDDMDILSELADLFPLKPDGHASRGRSAWKTAWIGASALAAGVLLTIGLLRQESPQPPPQPELASETYQTAIGEQASFELQDGSTVTLNTNSRLNVAFGGPRREVTLLRGEASFDVAHDGVRPFVVHVGSGLVWAVGTQFNVRLFSSEVDVTVTEGTVKVFAGIDPRSADLDLVANREATTREVVLDAGESARYDQRIEIMERQPAEAIQQKLAWQRGSLIFRGESLREAVAEISRYTEQELVIVDPSINDIPIGGHFKTQDIDALIASLDRNFQIRSEQVSPNRIHLYRQ